MISTSQIEILSIDDPIQRQKWRQLCDSFETIDVFYYPEYCKLFELHGDGKSLLFVYYNESGGIVIHPFLIRPLSEFLREKNSDITIFDITSPYGYNGYLRNNPKLDMDIFYEHFQNYCNDNNIISEFVRFHPLLNNANYAPRKVSMIQERETVVIDLTLSEKDFWSSLNPKCRNKIRKAMKNNVSVVLDENFNNIDTFYYLYTDTMQRLNAHKYYFFSKKWFYSLIELLKENVVLFHAIFNGIIINSSLCLFNDQFIHYYLSGSLFAERNMAANNILLYEVALWAQAKGIKYFHLGGGYQPNDSLSRFKAAFSPLRVKYYLGGVIHQPKYYEYLCKLRIKTQDVGAQGTYFPLYRISPNY